MTDGRSSLQSIHRPSRAVHQHRRHLVMLATLLLAVVAAGQFFGAAPTRSASLTTTLAPEADAYVTQAVPGANYGAMPTLSAQAVPAVESSYLRFNLSSLSGPITQATLRLFAMSSSKTDVSVDSVADTPWGETTITYANAPALGPVVATAGRIATGTWVNVDVTQLAQRKAKGTVAVAVTSTTNSKGKARLADRAAFASRETGVTAPQLIVATDVLTPTSTTATPSSSTTTTPTSTTTAPSTTTTSPPPPATGCVGPALSSQSQVVANTSYCGGVAHEQIRLAPGDTWTNGEVTGASAGSQRGALECSGSCTLNNMWVHDNPSAFASLYLFGDHIRINGGRFSGAASLGIGDDRHTDFVFDGVEVDRNGSSASCSFEGGGIKLVSNHVTVRNAYVHDNSCTGVWWDINGDYALVENSRIVNNANGGIFFEISHYAVFRNNVITGNGLQSCGWLWGTGIGVASSDNVEVYGNTLVNNCNGIGLTKQDRDGEGGTAHPLDHDYVHDNSVSGAPVGSQGWTGAASDDGTDLAALDIRFSNNSFSNGATFCGWDC